MAIVNGGPGNDFIHVAGDGRTPPSGFTDRPDATDGDDSIFSGGGSGIDHIYAGGGQNDIHFGADLTGEDIIQGGDGLDTLVLHGQTDVLFTATTLAGIDVIQALSYPVPEGLAGFHTITMHDANMAAGATLAVQASGLTQDISLFLNFAAETNAGRITVTGGAGSDLVTGRSWASGGANDYIDFSLGGADSAETGGRVYFGAAFDPADRVDGLGTGSVYLNGDYGPGLVLSATQFHDVASIHTGPEAFGGPGSDVSYHLVIDESLATADRGIAIVTSQQGPGTQALIDARGNLVGGVEVHGGQGNDTFLGGGGNDAFKFFGRGSDSFSGGGGDDTIVQYWQLTSDSVIGDTDLIDGGAGIDTLNVNGFYQFGLTLDGLKFADFEIVNVGADQFPNFGMSLTVWDAFLAAGETLTINARSLGTGSPLVVDASAERNGRVEVYGGRGADFVAGSRGNDRLEGGAGNDSLNGRAGRDRMEGGAGDDIYYVNDSGDQTIERSGGAASGIDTVYSTVSRTLGDNLEYLRLQGSAGRFGTGNALDNIIVGNSGSNRLRGEAGNDTLTGAAGDDELNGGTGTDSMSGGAGNDRYFIDRQSDRTVEDAADGGIDTVYSTVSRTLGDFIEHLRFQGPDDLNGNGNALANRLFGNAGANRLQGLAGNDDLFGKDGNDTLAGGEGNDTLTGGSNADVFRFAATNAGADRITDFQKGADRFQLSGGSFSKAVVAGADTILTHNGGTIRIEGVNTLTLAQWNALVIPGGENFVSALPFSAMTGPSDLYDTPAFSRCDPIPHGDWAYA
jgi:Ca2+-binding RTX toxin-like protein